MSRNLAQTETGISSIPVGWTWIAAWGPAGISLGTGQPESAAVTHSTDNGSVHRYRDLYRQTWMILHITINNIQKDVKAKDFEIFSVHT